MKTFNDLINTLHNFWQQRGCIIIQPIDLEVGAGTFHPSTFLRAIGPEPWNAAYVQSSRRPTDGRYGQHPNRNHHFYQYQVVLKPAPNNIQELYLESLKEIGIKFTEHDIRFVEDNWESPTLGSWGLGWEVWLNGMEITQFTYFQKMGGLECNPIMGELAYGIERLSMFLQNTSKIQELVWATTRKKNITYGDLFQQYETEMSIYNFKKANTTVLFALFDHFENECKQILNINLPIPAYEIVLKVSHIFNIIDARGKISVTERQRYILRIRTLANIVAKKYYEARKLLGFPLLKGPN